MKRTPLDEGRRFTVQELSAASGVSVPSIKFYVRQGLLPRGDASRPHRAYYDAAHLRRLAVIRALRDVAGLPIDVMRRALAAVDAPRADSVDVIAPAIDALASKRDAPPVDAALRAARADVTALFAKARLEVRADAGSRETLARTLAAIRRLGMEAPLEDVSRWLDALRPIAKDEIESDATRAMLLGDKESSLELAILGTVVFEPAIVALRRALHEHFTTRLVRGRAVRGARRPTRRRA